MVVTIAPDRLAPAAGYDHVARELAFEATAPLRSGRARREEPPPAGTTTAIARSSGTSSAGGLASSSVAGGRDSTEIEPGRLLPLPAGIVHRDVNPLEELQELALVFVGTGPLVVDVDGPDPG